MRNLALHIQLLFASSWSVGLFSVVFAAWQENVRPKMYVQLGAEDVFRFTGNETHTDYFRLVLRDENYLLVGGRNLVHNLSLTDLTEQQRLTWYSKEEDIKMCVMKGSDEEKCQNYVRILAKTGNNNLLVCATNAFKPMCRDYIVQAGNYSVENEKPAQARCPYDPQHNSTFVYVNGELYTGTVADFSGMDPIIYREPLQTEQYDSMSLNAPNFVSSMTQGDFVYFFFRETAVEYINCGKAVYSRVARVCKHDRGGPHRFRNRWTSFLKSRLNCSVTGDFPFYFNEIQSTTELISGQYGSTSAQLIYGAFTTPVNSISGSAVCAFSLQDIADTFEGNFKEQSALNSNWLPVQGSKVPDPRPGQCVNDSRTLPDLTLNFIKSHSLMDESVPSFFGQPIVIRTNFHYRFTQITVDPQVKTPGGKTYDVLFIGTDNGKVIKAINAESADSHQKVSPVVIEEIQAFPTTIPVRGIKVVRASQAGDGLEDGRLVVISDSQVQALRLHRCYSDRILSCGECVALQDPYCAWDKVEGKCRALVGPAATDATRFLQSVATGIHKYCPPSKTVNKDAGSFGAISANQNKFPQDSLASNKDGQGGPEVSAADSPTPQYSVETLVMAVVAGALSALFVGFVTGYLCGRKCRKDEDDNLPYPDTEYEYFEQRQNVNSRLAPEPKLLPQEEVTYAEPVLVPQPPKLHSPKGTMRKPPPTPAETLFQFPEGYGFRGPRDNFGTLRSHQGDAYRRNDGFATTRSVKKVYL
ncbi:semaphorin-1A isoform X3 [Leptopilina boulardi]|uniref:semaphorin-1A isoform X3 n=1 Tax=Leptopilina boulardi TaxID=63433 RepID=UPI0021F56E02|nr:semaphorin-1A isoform X3 [Leptopilina boulardi]